MNIDNVDGGIHRSIFVGRDVIGSLLITGDHNQVLWGDYERLRDAYISPQSVFDRVNLAHFTGREWLLAEIDAFLENHDRGYFIWEASAGLGKTTFMAWLAQQRHYIHHFSELAPGQEGIGIALRNLATQLALAYELRPEGVLPAAASRPDYLYELLTQAASQCSTGEKIILVVDALDEAGTPLNKNVLGLPVVLPEGVYVIVSQRPVPISLRVETSITPRNHVHLSATDANNQDDMHHFLKRVAIWPDIVRVLQANDYTADQFTTTLRNKCCGVWIYLHYVIHEIKNGTRSPLELETLPDGMTQYYAQYWQRWRDEDDNKWDSVYLPLLTMLATAREPLSRQQLIKWSGAEIKEQSLRRLLERQWRPFLAIAKKGEQSYYRLYHATLQEFFDGQLEQDNLSWHELEMIEELSKETRKCHHRLADRYLHAWGGWTTELKGLKDEQLRDMDDRYGLRHLAFHLEASGRIKELHNLLQVEWICKRGGWKAWLDKFFKRSQSSYRTHHQNAWYTVQDTIGRTDGYLADIARAWQLAKDSVLDKHKNSLELNGIREKEWQNMCIGLQCRYALITASLNSQANNIEPSLLLELIKMKLWSPVQGLSYARQITIPTQRTEMLIALVPFLRDKVQDEVLYEALLATRSIKENTDRARALATIVPYFTLDEQKDILDEQKTILDEMLSEACSIKDNVDHADVLTDLAALLAGEEQQAILNKALSIARSIEDRPNRYRVLANLASFLPRKEALTVLQEALAVADSMGIYSSAPDYARDQIAPILARLGYPEQALSIAKSIRIGFLRASTFTNIAPYLLYEEQQAILQQVLSDVNYIDKHYFQEYVIASFAPTLANLGHLGQGLSIARSIQDRFDRARALTDIASHLSPEKKQSILREALSLVRHIGDSSTQTRTLSQFASRFAELGYTEQALSVARHVGANYSQAADGLVLLAMRFAELGQPKQALSVTQYIEKNGSRAKVQAKLASRFAELGQPEQALLVAHHIDDHYDYYQAGALAYLVPHFSSEEQQSILDEALAVIHSMGDNYSQAEALANIVAYLSPAQFQKALSMAQGVKGSKGCHNRAAFLDTLVTRLSQNILEKAHLDAQSFKHYMWEDALIKLASHFVEWEQSKQSLSVDIDVLARLEAHPTLKKLQKMLLVAQSIEDSSSRSDALARLTDALAGHIDVLARLEAHPTLKERLQEMLSEAHPTLKERLQKMLLVAQSIEDSSSRSDVLLARLKTHPTSKEQLQETLSVAQSIEDSSSRSDALANLVPLLTKLPQSDLYTPWCEILEVLSQRTRSDLLSDLATLSELIAYLGKSSAISETTQAIQDVSRWWP